MDGRWVQGNHGAVEAMCTFMYGRCDYKTRAEAFIDAKIDRWCYIESPQYEIIVMIQVISRQIRMISRQIRMIS